MSLKCDCEECYWYYSGCNDHKPGCWSYYPNRLDDDFSVPEKPYDPMTNDPWGKAGFTIIDVSSELTGGDSYTST